ncbi:MAG: DUF1598 domain-containing protein [Planctomycetaceae bacterium]|nr:DUF1598 domain-containing protein [Planctomycetaceae bacterium]
MTFLQTGASPRVPSYRFTCLAMFALALLANRPAGAQFAVSDIQARPFVIGITPVIGRGGGVGGVSIDAQGVVARTDLDQTRRLRDLRLAAEGRLSGELAAASRMRKVSLRGIVSELDRLRRGSLPVTSELQNLAGLTRVEYVLVFPEQHDLVLAGPAEGWQVDESGTLVGQTTGRPVLQLDDLLVALRTARQQLTSGELITCSIDPTEEGSRRFSRLMKTLEPPFSKTAVARLEEAVGPQQVTLTGVAPGSHFAHVLVAADFRMKLLGMNLEPAPIDGLPSYLEMLQAGPARHAVSHAPRWWMAPRYEPLLRDADSLIWQIRGSGVQTLSEDGFLSRGGKVVSQRPTEDSLAKKWADAMTAKYESLAAKLPVFAELRNCMDLAVVGALVVHHDLAARADCDLSLLWDDKRMQVAQYHVPKTLASRASLLRKGRDWIVSVSGGIEIDSWSVLKQVEVQPDLADVRTKASPVKSDRWWWD